MCSIAQRLHHPPSSVTSPIKGPLEAGSPKEPFERTIFRNTPSLPGLDVRSRPIHVRTSIGPSTISSTYSEAVAASGSSVFLPRTGHSEFKDEDQTVIKTSSPFGMHAFISCVH